MKTIDLKAFRKANKILQIELAEYLGVGQSFISQIEQGTRPLPEEYISAILANTHNWDTSMFITEIPASKGVDLTSTVGLLHSTQMTEEKLRSAIEQAINPTEETLVGYLQRKIDDQDSLIRQLYQQIGMLEAKLDLIRKGEIAGTADGSSHANVG